MNQAAYSGVPLDGLPAGRNEVVTGSGGPSNSSDYKHGAVFNADTGEPYPPNTVIPGGTRLILYMGTKPFTIPDELTGGEPVTNSDIYTTVAGVKILKDFVEMENLWKLREQDQQRIDNESAQWQQDYDESVRQAKETHALDVKRVGIQEADALYRQKVGDASGRLQTHLAKLSGSDFSLRQNQFNASQRQAKAGAEFDVLDMLAARKGPQDWVAYNNLLSGLDAPTPERSATIDPFARLEGLYEESTLEPPAVPEWESTQVPIGPGSPPGGAAQSSGNEAAEAAARAAAEAAKVQHAEHGGYGNMLVAGDDSEGKENQELAMSASPITMIPIKNDSLRDVKIPHAEYGYRKIPHMETGGTYGTALNEDTITENQYSPADLGNQPFIRKLFGKSPSREFGGFGATLSNPKLGLSDVPFGFNMQNFNQLQSSEKKASRELYERGLGVDFDDVLGSSRRAAPTGMRFGPKFWGG